MVYRAVVVARLTYAASAWLGFASNSDRSRLEAVLRRGKWCGGLCSTTSTIADLVDRADDELLETTLHVLHTLLPKETDSCYDFRHGRHNRILINKSKHLADSDSITLRAS